MKETLYKKVQDLFPSELGVGDVVEYRKYMDWNQNRAIWKILNVDKDNRYIISLSKAITRVGKEDLKLIRKRITLSMALEAMRRIDKFYYQRIDLNTAGFLIITVHNKEIKWKLQENGKDLSLYDQSIKLLKLVYEVLKNE